MQPVLFGCEWGIGVRFSEFSRALKPLRKNRTNRNFIGPVIIGTAIYLFSPTIVAYQDMASMLSGA
ncbi:hypothetical protein LJD47_32855, partial [Escherichia coli]|nr:hypothetical protein [Escherichia coli]